MKIYCKRLIEVDLPIKRISEHARREKTFPVPRGHISTLHTWWARRPLAACRAVICATFWPDPIDKLCPATFQEKAWLAMTNFCEKTGQKELTQICSNESWIYFQRFAKQKKCFDSNPDDLKTLRELLLYFIGDFASVHHVEAFELSC